VIDLIRRKAVQVEKGSTVVPVTPDLLATEIAELVAARPGRVRLALDGPPPTHPRALADAVAVALRTRGRAVVVVDAADYLRPASLRLEHGRTDPDTFLDGWLDVGGLRREVLDPAAAGGSGRVLPRLWDASADRAYRDRYLDLPPDGVVVLAGALLLGRGLPLELAVHLRMSAAALARRLPDDLAWTLPAYARYEKERDPAGAANLLVLADHPERPAIHR
jgi:hypothetical protein